MRPIHDEEWEKTVIYWIDVFEKRLKFFRNDLKLIQVTKEVNKEDGRTKST